MDYKSYMGYGEKKTKKVEKTLPKKNTIIENVQNEIKDYPLERVLNEVGASADYHKVTKQIELSYKKYWDNVKNLEKIMTKKGQQKEAKTIHKQYAKYVLGFHSWLRGQIDKLL